MKHNAVVLIDDDEDDREVFIEAIKEVSSEITCITFSDGRTALDSLSKENLNTDVIFLDLNMPLMKGAECLVQLRKLKKFVDTPIFIYSTSAHTSVMGSTIPGATDYITKPDDYSELVMILKTRLAAIN